MNAIVPLTSWTPERIEELRTYAAEGLGAAQIAFRMRPITELAIIGRAAREGIVLGVKPPKASVQRRSRFADPLQQDDQMFGVAPPAREDAWIPLPGTEPVPLLELGGGQCPWPIGGNDADVAYACCAAPRPDGLPYCREHTALAYVNGRYRRSGAFVAAFIRNNERRYA